MAKRRTEKKKSRESRAEARRPGLRQLLFKDLRPADLPRNFRLDLRQLYRFYLDEERRAQLAAMGRIRRSFKIVAWLLKSLLAKLSPGRRLALFASLVMCFIGKWRFGMRGEVFSTDLRLWGFLILLLVFMLEMMDKVLAKDEIEVARQVQLALLPSRHPQPEGLSLWSFMRPANDVGADLVDYIHLPGGRLGVVLGDVAGKGLGAALLTAKLQATLRAIVPTCPSLSDLGAQLNAIIFRDGIDNRFVTLFYFEVDPASGRMRYLNAGHNPPFLLRESGIEALPASAIPLGMMEGTTYAESELLLRDGDTLVIYSDGLTEARNAGDEEFGAERLRSCMPRLRGLSAETGVRVIIDEVNAFLAGERPHDDLSLVVLARPGEGASREIEPERPGPVPPPRITPPPLPG
jgi:hypothetical protein